MKMKVKKTGYYSWKSGPLATGCRQCVKGEKLVLFVTGLCTERCDFCPVSDRKLYKDVIYANERLLKNPSDTRAIIEEAVLCSAKGAGITGGDPLMVIGRTVKYIALLKKAFGKHFHIHLYTPLKLVNEEKLRKLYYAGLDEIRFHMDIQKPALWDRMILAKRFSWKVGVEIPVFPGTEKESKTLIDWIRGKADFLNLNELELADNAVWRKKDDIVTKDRLSYAIKGSESLAMRLIRYSARKGIKTHYCTCRLKDRVQLAERMKRRAKNIKQSFDLMTEDSMLIRGAIYLPSLKPGFGYHDKLDRLKANKRKQLIQQLGKMRKELLKENGLKADELVIDQNKLRILASPVLVDSIRKKGIERAIVTEYPTHDALEIEVDMLSNAK